MISFMLCYVSWTSLIRLKIYINSTYEYQINEEALHIKQYEMRKITAKGDFLQSTSLTARKVMIGYSLRYSKVIE